MSRRSSGSIEREEQGDKSLSLGKRPPGEPTRCRGRISPSEGRPFSERDSSPRLFAFVAAALLLAALPAAAQKPHKAKPMPATIETAVIENTGSTNTLGYRVSISSNGKTRGYEFPGPLEVVIQRPHWLVLSKEVPAKFFRDLHATQSLIGLPVRHGLRSSSFGTATYVTYKGQRSPDLTLPGNDKAQALHDDMQVIGKALHVGGPNYYMHSRPC